MGEYFDNAITPVHLSSILLLATQKLTVIRSKSRRTQNHRAETRTVPTSEISRGNSQPRYNRLTVDTARAVEKYARVHCRLLRRFAKILRVRQCYAYIGSVPHCSVRSRVRRGVARREFVISLAENVFPVVLYRHIFREFDTF